MFEPLKKLSPFSGESENLLMYVEWLRQQAEEFQKAVEEERRTVSSLLEEVQVRQAKRRGHHAR